MPRRPAAHALVNLHSACGVGNAMGAVVNAFHNRAPLVITAGNQDRRHLESEPYLFARSTALMDPYVKFSHEPPRPQDVPAAIDRAWALASTPPQGPAFVSIPSGDWDAPAEASPATSVAPRRGHRGRSRRRPAGPAGRADRRRRCAGADRGWGRGPGGSLGRRDRAGRAAERSGVDRAPGPATGLSRGSPALPGPPRPRSGHLWPRPSSPGATWRLVLGSAGVRVPAV